MEFESFDVLGTPYLQKEDKIALINQVNEELIASSPSYGYKLRFHSENQVTVTYHCFEMDLPLRIKEVDDQAEKCLKEWEKTIKKQFKAKGGGTLKLKELKDSRDRSVEKVSLNNRYFYRFSKTFEIK